MNNSIPIFKQNMAKRFKLKLSLNSFQLCRSKQPSTLPTTLITVSPVNSKSFDITFPYFPDPPPSTPNHPLFKHQVSSKIKPVNSRIGSKVVTQTENMTSKFKRESADYVEKEHDQKMYNSPVSEEFDDGKWPVKQPKGEVKKQAEKKKSKPSVCTSISSGNSGWFSSEDDETNEETESLVCSSRSFDSSYDFGYSLKTINETPVAINQGRKKKNNLKVGKLRRFASNNQRSDEKTKTKNPESESPVKKSVFRRLMPCKLDGKVNDSFAVVKRSEDPYEDFKRSMLEMILEKEMFETKDLEQLLQCFLSLNARHHHAVIIEAFTDIWDVLFCKSTKSESDSIGF